MKLEELIEHLNSIDIDVWYKPYGNDEPIPLGKIAAETVRKLKQMREGLRQIKEITKDYVKEGE